MEPHYSINILPIFVCALIAMGLDFLYYSPMLLGKIWITSDEKSEDIEQNNFIKIKLCIINFLSQFVMAYILARLMSYIGASTPQEGIRIAFIAWLGFIATSLTMSYVSEGKKFTQFLIDGGFHFIVLLIFGIILGAWH